MISSILFVSNVGIDLSSVARYLLSKEAYIMDNYPFVSDFGTLLPTNITTRSGGYNVFSFIPDCPDLEVVLNHIRHQYYNYISVKGMADLAVCPAINCWVNILRVGEQVHEHSHADMEESFVSGALSIQVENTETYYKRNGEVIETVLNTNGDLSLFPCNLYHGTTIHQSVEPRITLGMDIFFDMNTCRASESFYNTLVKL